MTKVDPRTVPVRFSRLRQFMLSAAHYRAALEEDGADTAALRRGRAVHQLVAGEEPIVYDGVRRGRDFEAVKSKHPGADILNVREYDEARAIADAIMGHATARALLVDDVERERTIEWSIGGRRCAGTPDAFNARRVVDLKTTRSSEPRRFVRDGTFRAYHSQVTWYADGIRAAELGDPSELFVVAVEAAPPFPVTVFQLTPTAIDLGRRLYRLWFEQLLACEASDDWPAYAAGVVPFDVEPPLELDFGDELIEVP